MKWLTGIFCVLFLAGMMVVAPGCDSGGGPAEQIDASNYDDTAGAADEMGDEEGSEEDTGGGTGSEME